MRLVQPGIPGFGPTIVLPDVFNRSNFEYSAFSSLKVEKWQQKNKKKEKKKKRKRRKIVFRLG